MKRFIEGEDRNQSTLFPECLDDYIAEDNAVRVVDVFIDELDIAQLGFGRIKPKPTGRPAYHPSMLLKLYQETDPTQQRAAGLTAPAGYCYCPGKIQVIVLNLMILFILTLSPGGPVNSST